MLQNPIDLITVTNLVVAAIGLACGVQNTLPVLLLVLRSGVDVDQHLKHASLLPHRIRLQWDGFLEEEAQNVAHQER